MVPELRARGVGEMLDLAVALYRERFVRLIVLTALVVVPVQVLSTIILLSAQPEGYTVSFTGSTTPRYDTQSALVQLAGSLVVLFVGYVSTAFVIGLCTRPVADTYIGATSGWKRGSIGGRGVFAVLATCFLVAGAEILGFAVCGLGYFAAIAFFAVALPALILERTGPAQALGRSFNLTKTHFFRVLGLIVSAQLLGTVLNVGLAAGLSFWLRNGASTDAAVITQGIASAISATITTPLLAAAAVVVYFDCRIRDEAFDVQLLMQRNDARYAAQTPGPAPMQPTPAR